MLNIVCQLLHVDAVLVICSVFGSQNYKQEHNILHVMETCMNCLTKIPFLNVNKLNSFPCTVYGAYKDFEERLYCFLS